MTAKSHLWFICNSCNAVKQTKISLDLREGLSCPTCGLNSRQRAILLATQRVAKRMADSKKPRIIGVSDGASIESVFRSRFGTHYRNYEFHKEPFLDITRVDKILASSADIVKCSEVLEHVQSPIDLAFRGLFTLLKPGGWLILSVPHGRADSQHIEHFPVMKDSKLITEPKQTLTGIDLDGKEREFSDLIFHGGAGATLEYRVFSESSLRSNLKNSGFDNILPQKDKRVFGCIWEPWSRVWVAQKPNL